MSENNDRQELNRICKEAADSVKFSELSGYCSTCQKNCPINFIDHGKKKCKICGNPMVTPDEKILQAARDSGSGKKSMIKRAKQEQPEQGDIDIAPVVLTLLTHSGRAYFSKIKSISKYMSSHYNISIKLSEQEISNSLSNYVKYITVPNCFEDNYFTTLADSPPINKEFIVNNVINGDMDLFEKIEDSISCSSLV